MVAAGVSMAARSTASKSPPELATARLRLVPPSRRHIGDLFAYGSRADFTTFLDSKPFRTRRDAERFLLALQKDNRAGKRMYWVAELKDDKRAVGTLGLLFPFAPHHRVAEFGYGFAPDVWGSGLFAEAAQAVVNYGFATLGLRRIQALTRAANVRSIKGIEKIGFRQEAVLSEFYEEHNGERSSAALLALLAPRKGSGKRNAKP
jgi:RimJ/RimL family protein N-acetyltransferase